MARFDRQEGAAHRGAFLEDARSLDADFRGVHQQEFEALSEHRLQGDLVFGRHLEGIRENSAQAAVEIPMREDAGEFLLKQLRPAAQVSLQFAERGQARGRGVEFVPRGEKTGLHDRGLLPSLPELDGGRGGLFGSAFERLAL